MEKITLSLEAVASLAGIGKKELLEQLKTSPDKDEFKPEAEIQASIEAMIGDKFKKVAEDHRKRGVREAATKLERNLREKFNVSSTLEGIELIEDIVASQVEAAKKASGGSADPAQMSREDLLKVSAVQELLKEKIAETDTVKQQFEAFKSDTETRLHADKVARALEAEYMSLRPVLADDEAMKKRQVDFFLKSLDPKRFKVEGDKLVPLDDSGEPMKDAKFNTMTASDYLRANSPFPFHQHDPNKGGAGANPNPQGGGGGGNVPTFQTQEELATWMANTSDVEMKRQAVELFKKRQG